MFCIPPQLGAVIKHIHFCSITYENVYIKSKPSAWRKKERTNGPFWEHFKPSSWIQIFQILLGQNNLKKWCRESGVQYLYKQLQCTFRVSAFLAAHATYKTINNKKHCEKVSSAEHSLKHNIYITQKQKKWFNNKNIL